MKDFDTGPCTALEAKADPQRRASATTMVELPLTAAFTSFSAMTHSLSFPFTTAKAVTLKPILWTFRFIVFLFERVKFPILVWS